ncbi:MAG: tRNA 2-thiouridine(34) synthase MnmA [Pseudomonadales bacterium]|nr:tRNA 2-thiouridine(34) synthase MnmA [Pseudomonadales bacterium]
MTSSNLSSLDPKQTRVIVGMSGGVDSSVSAHLLQQQGFQVEGLFMKNWEEDDGTEYCTAKEDLADAQSVCDRLGIHLHTANFAAEYWDNVFEHFLKEYKEGRTPNPDVLCNREIKFKAFLEYAQELGADYIATGHYVQRRDEQGSTYLCKGLDSNKDQSYFLCEVAEESLRKSLFPIGELNKSEVRSIAQDLRLTTHDKKDSTGICFIGERKFKDFLETYLPAQPGPIESADGETLGQHAGLMYYTLGQRQGLGIGGIRNRLEAPWYVVDKDLARNVLIVSQGNENEDLFSTELIAQPATWINGSAPELPLRCSAKIRYRQQDQQCEITALSDSAVASGKIRVTFDKPQRAVTPGQYAVFYQQDRCLGGAIIDAYSS